MTTALDKQANTLEGMLEQMKPQIEKTLPKWITPDRMLRVVLTELRTTPKLAQCDTKSVLASVMQCAQLGLEPGGVLGHAYMIPYKTTCQVIIGYKGLIDLARRSGEIISISARVVHKEDHFEYSYGLKDKLEHTPAHGDRGEPIYVYAVASLRGGGHAYEVMTVEDVNKIRDNVRYLGKDSPWKTYWGEMARKTAIRRLFKYLPVSIIPREAHDILHSEDERFAVDTTATAVDQPSVLTPGRHSLKKPKDKPAEEEKPAEDSDFEVTAVLAYAVDQAAVESGWDMPGMNDWIKEKYGKRLKQITVPIHYDEILNHFRTEDPDGNLAKKDA